MPIDVIEHISGPRVFTGDGAGVEQRYIVRGTADEGEVRQALNDETADHYNIGLDGEFWIPRVHIDVEPIGEDTWDCSVRYATRTLTPLIDAEFSFETSSGGTEHITQSLGTRRYPPDSILAPDLGGAIGVTDDGVEGVDIIVPKPIYTEVYRRPSSDVTNSYVMTLEELTGTVNNATFKGRAADEVLFLGAAGRKSGRWGHWEIEYRFATSRNRTGLVVGDITDIVKKGWEYLWVRYKDVVTPGPPPNALVKRPVGVYVEQVYPRANFALLGIGT